MNRPLVISYCLLITAMLFVLAGCVNTANIAIDWNLHGVWVAADGTVQTQTEKVDISLSGTLPKKFEPYSTVEVELDFFWPNSSLIQDDSKSTYTAHAQFADQHNNQHLYHIGACLSNHATHKTTDISLTICPEEGFVVVHKGQYYLVASTDPNADFAEIFAFYKAYVHVSG